MSVQGRVLVVDDDRLNRALLTTNLRGIGYFVATAENGKQALTMLAAELYDVILLDLVMPEMDGFEVLGQLGQHPTLHQIPVIVISVSSEIEGVARCIELGATDYLTKPFNATVLRARLAASLATKRLHDAQQAHLQSLESHNAELDAFAHTVAHDLKQPLGAIMGYGELLVDEYHEMADQERLELIAKMTQMSHAMNRIIRELLLLASTRKEDVQPEPMDMGRCVAAVQDRLALMIKTRQPALSLPEQWPVALGYEPWIEEVWANYLSNALKYGGAPPQIALGATPQANGAIRFWVRDQGPGIPPEKQTKLFVPFARLNQVRIEGQGLGLSIVQRIITKLGGQVGVDSTPGQGSTFWFELPAAAEIEPQREARSP